ncbi:cardiolipin synthase [Horticoccus luteus]|uniref:Cardiolipin synthase n=1 Tax=Horticoccus luteus TaxID=2862869 RepID=A0A8F9TYX3_9BACT|nr:cardiolipin synthase [Horticoccus luteus]QYM80298.1 cardiolipin synthase [Horticoccus luteus]
MTELVNHPFINAVLPHLIAIGGFLLALFLIARLMSEKRQPSNTVAWLLVIVLVPYVGVPLYLLLGGRKLRTLMARKGRLQAKLLVKERLPSPHENFPIAQTVMASGAEAPVVGNTIRLLTTGEDAYAALEENIRAAKQCIHIIAFILGRDDTGRRIVRLLAAKAKEGVKVRLLLDTVGCMFLSRDFLAPLKQAGGEVGWFMPVLPFTLRGTANLRNHRKIAVFDYHTAIVGGHNMAREYIGPAPYRKRWRDFGAVIDGPAATVLHEVFVADWCFATKETPERLHAEMPAEATAPRGTSELQVVASGPDVRGDPLYEGILAMIQEAEKSVWIVTPYFIPDEVLLRSLIVKARTGRDVTLILPARSNHPITDFARRYYVRELQRAGGRVRLFGPGMMHSKAMIVDDQIGLFGSPNFDLRSLFVNFEIGVLVHTASDVQAMKAWATELFDKCHPPKGERARRSFVGSVLEDLSRLLAPLL